ncbi:hypothetical protein ROLI_021670 [Roseobacter fucihabitans]|uniref:Lipoprotein n=1 Tax=Roseobacter fucihabitans TaxID=1537242 RepID=A0ABZ2BSS9_9RHOB|nr:hypothetical protein [Roseobacter litoralis]MBC6967737.1 hypothetical protein [Roseobacter litoralis]
MADGLWAVNSIVLWAKASQNGEMKVFGALIKIGLVCVALVACAPLSIYYKEGAEVTRLQTDQLNCEIAALSDVPVSNQIRQEPPVYIPSRRYCDGAGRCHIRGGFFEPGQIYTVDVNANLRGRAEGQCMAQKGYAPVTVPNCPNAVFRAAPKGATQVLPRLSAQSCVIQYQDDTWQIVNQSG